MLSRALAITAVVACELLTACDIQRRPTGPGGTRVDAVVVVPATVVLDPLQAFQFRAFGLNAAGDSVAASVTWSASAGTITAGALFTADSSDNDAVVTATLTGAPAITATASVRKRRIVTIVLTPASVTLLAGGVQQFTARGVMNTGDTVAVSANYSATGGAVTSGGLYTAASTAGSYRVIAARPNRSLADTAAVTITSIPVAAVAVSPTSASVPVGQTVQLTATPQDANGNPLTGRVVTWVSDATGVATVNGSGLVTGVAAGSSATLTATSEGKNGTAMVTVTAVSAPVASVAVNPASASVPVGQTVQLTATPEDANGSALIGRVVTWASSVPGVATVSASGLVTAVAAGTATLTATSEGQSGTATVTTTAVPVALVTVTPAAASLFVGKTAQLAATTKDSAGNVLTGRVITWAVSNTTVATVSATGLVTARAAGSATITATSEGKNGTATVTVANVPVASVTISPASASVLVGGTAQLAATTKDSAGNVLTGRTITWASGNLALATVSGTGLVTGLAAGAPTITATSEGKTGTATVTVTVSSGSHAGWYAAPAGSPGGDGSSNRPWDLQTAMNGGNGRVQPGDTIWLRGGTYGTGAINTTLTGTASAPIVVRQYPGERAILDANGGTSGTTRGDFFIVSGNYSVFWGFEVMDSDLNRTSTSRPNLVIANASHLKFINLIVHDGGIGFYTYPEQSDIEIYGCVIYYNGWQQPDFGNGHGIYSKSTAGPVYLRDNIVFDQFGYGIHVYANAGSGGVNNIHVEGNVSFNNGSIDTDPNSPSANLLYGGGDPATGGSIVDNMTYFSPNVGQHNLMIGYSGTANISLTAQNNYAVGGQTVFEVGYWQALTMSGNSAFGAASDPVNLRSAATGGFQLSNNRYYRDPTLRAWLYSGTSYTFGGWQQAAGVGATDQAQAATPTQPQVFVRPSRYEVGRGNVIIYNWGRQASVAVDLSGVLQVGSRYEIRNVENFFAAPVASGTYGGGSVSIPTSGVTPAQVVGGSPTAPPRTGPDFDVFVVVTVSP